MTTFDERESAFETKFAHDAEMQFRAEARRNKLIALWAAELLGKPAAESEDYAREVMKADLSEPGSEDVLRKLAGDLGDLASESEIRAKLNELLVVAKGQILGEI